MLTYLGLKMGKVLKARKWNMKTIFSCFSKATSIFKEAQSLYERLELTSDEYKDTVFEQLTECTALFSKCTRNLREYKKSKDQQL